MEREKKRTDPASHVLSAICPYQVCLINSVAGCAAANPAASGSDGGRPAWTEQETVVKWVTNF